VKPPIKRRCKKRQCLYEQMKQIRRAFHTATPPTGKYR
jgi:hypothetical protein